MLCLIPVAHPRVAVGRSVVYYDITMLFSYSDMFQFCSNLLEISMHISLGDIGI